MFQLFFVTLRVIAKDEELVYWIDDPDLMWTKKRAEKKSKSNLRNVQSHANKHKNMLHNVRTLVAVLDPVISRLVPRATP